MAIFENVSLLYCALYCVFVVLVRASSASQIMGAVEDDHIRPIQGTICSPPHRTLTLPLSISDDLAMAPEVKL